MGIVEEDIVRVREQTDMVGLVSQYTQLKRVGARQVGLCPFHSEKTPSFSVNTELNLYKCFGCGVSGDAITFVREMEHLDFVGAVEQLAAKAGVTLRYTNRDEGEGRKRRARLTDALERAVDFYHQRLLTGRDAGAARKYLRDRGYTGEQVREYRIGWAPDDWDALAKQLRLPAEVMVDTGLGLVNRRNRIQDFFRARVLFPIFDERGDPVSFGGRIMPGATGPKYLNTAETPVYRKSRTLYGLNWHKADIVAADELVVCEGYTDVIGLADAGVPRGVATCGTALTEDHVRTMKKFASKLVLAFDADEAGQAAADRVYEWERTHELQVRVAAMPGGADPGDLARQNPAALKAAIDDAQPFLGYRVDRALALGDLSSIEGRARAAETAIAVIAEHPSDFVRDQYVMRVASACHLEPDLVRGRLSEQRRRGGPAIRLASGPTRRERNGADREAEVPAVDRFAAAQRHPELARTSEEALALLVQAPDEISDLLTIGCFLDPVFAETFRRVTESADVHAALVDAPPEVADLIARSAVAELSDPLAVLVRLVDQAASTRLRMLTSSQGGRSDEAGRLAHWLARRISGLRRPDDPDVDDLFDLRDWLDARSAEESSGLDVAQRHPGDVGRGVSVDRTPERVQSIDVVPLHEADGDAQLEAGPPGSTSSSISRDGDHPGDMFDDGSAPLPDESMMSDAELEWGGDQ